MLSNTNFTIQKKNRKRTLNSIFFFDFHQQLAHSTQRTHKHGEILLPGSVQILRLPLHSNRDDGFFRHEPEQFRGNHSEPNVRRVPGECAGSTLGRGDEKVD